MQACEELPLIHLTTLKCAAYTFRVRFFGLPPISRRDEDNTTDDTGAEDTLDSRVQEVLNEMKPKSPIPAFEVEEIELILQTRNTTFTYFEMISRFLSFLATFVLLVRAEFTQLFVGVL